MPLDGVPIHNDTLHYVFLRYVTVRQLGFTYLKLTKTLFTQQ